jgi:hypothetical protein
MADPNALDFIRIPTSVLVTLDWRPYHFAIQPYHYLIRVTHILSMATFFGCIAALDLRLMGWWPALSLRALADHVTPLLYITFGSTIITGVALFLYDPVHVGSHAYFGLKLVLTCVGFVNAAVFRRGGYLTSLAPDASTSQHSVVRARLAGALSLAIWTGVVICACLNVEAAPKVLLR